MLGKLIKCIKFPFLYPRNRWTGLHYNNWEILDWVREKRSESSVYLCVSYSESKVSGKTALELGDGKTLRLETKGYKLTIILSEGYLERVVDIIEAPGIILDAVFGDKGSIKVWITKLSGEPKFEFSKVIYRPLLYLAAVFVDWFHTWPLQLLHCIPSRTELDALEDGWKKAFGEDLCKDLRRALWKEGGLRAILNFRITQIKEKYGYLHFYYTGGGEEVRKVISKYEVLSGKTCIICGKPAKWISRGWISPYCDDCISDKDYADPIDEKEDRDF